MKTTLKVHRAVLVVVLTAGTGWSADRMVGVVPTDGSTMLVKEFSVSAGTTITGVRLENNDTETTFPEVALVRGPLATIAGGTVVATVSSVHPGGGAATVDLSPPVTASEAGTYYVAVRFPAGPGKQGLGQGPALGAFNVARPNGSYVAANSNEALVPMSVDLTISLVTASSSVAKARGVRVEDPPAADGRTLESFFTARTSSGRFPATVAFGLPKAADVAVSVYDVSGRLVRELVRESLAAGLYEKVWDGRNELGKQSAAGVYFVRFESNTDVLKQKIVVAQ